MNEMFIEFVIALHSALEIIQYTYDIEMRILQIRAIPQEIVHVYIGNDHRSIHRVYNISGQGKIRPADLADELVECWSRTDLHTAKTSTAKRNRMEEEE